ncbi:ANTAR domain-containing protein [Actinoplanes sp. NEAU-A12]|uniref:ANTAR domain-containing protein n=1 Tax=Actinoplanes sandaracinus TaxID=3045177 RepID=A0ABT6WNV4_9ACTN|nr:ANTAR domain-containing protein [Actinoplanes sandaracinus]MDI6101386.1 ANTAR domain-containing protein [Actinoplanes sandaracinus]
MTDDATPAGQSADHLSTAFLEIITAGAQCDDSLEPVRALLRSTRRLLRADGAGVFLADTEDRLRVVAVTSAAVGRLEATELACGRGPCVESHRRAVPVAYPDAEVADPRWPGLGPAIRATGARAVHAIPMLGGRRRPIGVLHLFHIEPGLLDEKTITMAGALAGAAAHTVGHRDALRCSRLRIKHLETALASRVIIEQAKGMLAVRWRISPDAAFARLRQLARDTNQNLHELAGDIVAGTFQPAAGVDGPEPGQDP